MKKQIFKFLFFVTFFPLICFGYTPLVQVDGLTTNLDSNNPNLISEYLLGLYKFGVGLAAAIAIVLIIIGGFQYATTDAIGGKEDGKERIRNAIGGLLLALFSFLILNTIDPRLTSVDFNLGNAVKVDTDSVLDILQDPNFIEEDNYSIPGVTPVEPAGAIGEKTNIPAGIRVDSQGKQVDITMKSSLERLNQELGKNNIGWAVTEAYPPSRQHKAPCHQTGTCIDANFRSTDASPENVKKFLQSASTAGLRAVYEVQSESERTRFVNAGVPAESIVNLGSWITAPHFSVYSN